MPDQFESLPRNSNQARGIAEYAIAALRGEDFAPADDVLARTELFHLDSVACGAAALAIGTNAPRVLREEALRYPAAGSAAARVFSSGAPVQVEKAIAANGSAVRELDSNGTNFGYNRRTGDQRGEFGHNDFYPVAIAAAQVAGLDGRAALRGMVCLDEIRGRLAEVFGLKDHKIDHVVHGGIAAAAVYGAMVGATAEQIESAIGLLIAHYIPFRAIRAGHQLSDSKGASAAITAEAAVLSTRRAMAGFRGPADVFRNPQAIFCLFEPPEEPDSSPFDLQLATTGGDFAVMGMHFKLGLYEHQSAGAIHGLMQLLSDHPGLLADADAIQSIRIQIYEPAFSIIGDPAKRDPRTRQSADHSMVYIMATLLRKAIEGQESGWRELILLPADYDNEALFHDLTRRLMDRIEFAHGGPDYDAKYPDGIPTSIEIEHRELGTVSSGLVMYPKGHARNRDEDVAELLDEKFRALASLGVDDADSLKQRLGNLQEKTAADIVEIYNFPIRM